MGLETGNYIADLRKDWPLSTDYRREGDDHLRLLKKVLVQTFPNLDGPVTLEPAQINNLADYVAQVETELYKHTVPIGCIQMWPGASPPTGWLLCNGSTFSAVTYPDLAAVLGASTTPDLRNRFIVGAGQNYTVKSTGGSDTPSTSSAGGHDHGGTGEHVLTMQELPDLSAGLTIQIESDWTASSQSDSHYEEGWVAGGRTGIGHAPTSAPFTVDQPGGGGDGHSHTIPTGGAHQHTVDNRPQYYALTFIIKALEPTAISAP